MSKHHEHQHKSHVEHSHQHVGGESDEQRIEEQERAALNGQFKWTTVVWVVIPVAIAVLVWYLIAFK